MHSIYGLFRFTKQIFRDLGYTQQALYCYRKAYSLDPTNVDALWDRASLAKSIGEYKTVCMGLIHSSSSIHAFLQARNAFLAILKRFPHDLSVLRELHTILVELSDLTGCAELFQQAFDHYQRLYPSGFALDPATNVTIEGGGFGNLELLLLADLYNTLGEHESAIEVIRKGTRWLQGRAEQKYWDLCEDDREYDLPEWTTRVGSGGEDATEVTSGRFPLDINARHRLAVARIKLGEVEEGKVSSHFLCSYGQLLNEPSCMLVSSCLKTSKILPSYSLKLRMRISRSSYGRRRDRYMSYLEGTLKCVFPELLPFRSDLSF